MRAGARTGASGGATGGDEGRGFLMATFFMSMSGITACGVVLGAARSAEGVVDGMVKIETSMGADTLSVDAPPEKIAKRAPNRSPAMMPKEGVVRSIFIR